MLRKINCSPEIIGLSGKEIEEEEEGGCDEEHILWWKQYCDEE